MKKVKIPELINTNDVADNEMIVFLILIQRIFAEFLTEQMQSIVFSATTS